MGGWGRTFLFCAANTNKWVTARFCQLDTGDSDACDILRSKLRITDDNGGNGGGQGKRRRERDQQQQQQRRKGQPEPEAEEKMEFFCGICKSDHCNGADAVTLELTSYLAMGLLQVLLMRMMMMRC